MDVTITIGPESQYELTLEEAGPGEYFLRFEDERVGGRLSFFVDNVPEFFGLLSDLIEGKVR